MKRNLFFALFAVITGVLSLCSVYFNKYFYPKNYVMDNSGEYINITVSDQKKTFPVNKYTIFNVEYVYPEEDKILKEQLKAIPALLGCDKDGVNRYLDDYMQHISQKEQEAGLISYEMVSYKDNEINLRKTFKTPIAKGFYAKSFNGLIVILKGDEKTVYEYTQISLASLPEDMRDDILNGYYLENEEALYSFLENYTS